MCARHAVRERDHVSKKTVHFFFFLEKGEEGGQEKGGRKNREFFFWLTSPSDSGCDKCHFRAHQFSQLRPDQAEALCT